MARYLLFVLALTGLLMMGAKPASVRRHSLSKNLQHDGMIVIHDLEKRSADGSEDDVTEDDSGDSGDGEDTTMMVETLVKRSVDEDEEYSGAIEESGDDLNEEEADESGDEEDAEDTEISRRRREAEVDGSGDLNEESDDLDAESGDEDQEEEILPTVGEEELVNQDDAAEEHTEEGENGEAAEATDSS